MPPLSSSKLEAVAALKRGEAVIFPTETVYGLGVSVEAAASPEALYDLKERDRGKPVSWLVGGVDDLDRYGAHVPDLARRLARAYWPGPLTLIVEAGDAVPAAFRSAAGSIGLRMPDNATALALVRAAGCHLATTSANLSGRAAAGALDALDAAGGHDNGNDRKRHQDDQQNSERREARALLLFSISHGSFSLRERRPIREIGRRLDRKKA